MSDTRSCYGHTFVWTNYHYSEDQLLPYQFTYDVMGSKALDKMEEMFPVLTGSGQGGQNRMLAKIRPWTVIYRSS